MTLIAQHVDPVNGERHRTMNVGFADEPAWREDHGSDQPAPDPDLNMSDEQLTYFLERYFADRRERVAHRAALAFGLNPADLGDTFDVRVWRGVDPKAPCELYLTLFSPTCLMVEGKGVNFTEAADAAIARMRQRMTDAAERRGSALVA